MTAPRKLSGRKLEPGFAATGDRSLKEIHEAIAHIRGQLDESRKLEDALHTSVTDGRFVKQSETKKFVLDFELAALEKKVSQLRRDFELHKHPGGEGDPNAFLNSQFYTALKDGETLIVTVNSGALIRGTSTTIVPETDVEVSSIDDTYYVYLEAWYGYGGAGGPGNLSLGTQFSFSNIYPDQDDITKTDESLGTRDFPCERVLVATVVVDQSAISEVYPQRIGEIHSTRIW